MQPHANCPLWMLLVFFKLQTSVSLVIISLLPSQFGFSKYKYKIVFRVCEPHLCGPAQLVFGTFSQIWWLKTLEKLNIKIYKPYGHHMPIIPSGAELKMLD